MPRRSNNFAQLGGRDSASACGADGRLNSVTRWPHDTRRRAAAAPAGPPPITATSMDVEALDMLEHDLRERSDGRAVGVDVRSGHPDQLLGRCGALVQLVHGDARQALI